MEKRITVFLLCLIVSHYVLAGNLVVGDYGSSISVSPTGAALYNIPIECPKGVNGMEPSIALVYNSQSGLSVLGKGWNLSAASVITKTAATPYYDGKLLPINYDNSADHLMLDGQRLIKYQTINSTEVEFRFENDNYNRIIRKGSKGNFYFEVYTTNGRKMTYKQQPEGASYYNGNLGWYLTTIEDLSGNYISYDYAVTSSNGNISTVLLNTIRYGGNILQGTAHTLKVEFNYDASLLHPCQYYIAGHTKSIYKILSEIRTYANTSTLNTKYEIAYTYDALDNRLLSYVKKYGNNGDYLDKINIEWNTPNNGLSCSEQIAANVSDKSLIGSTNETISDRQWFLCDYDNDGYPDLVSYCVKNTAISPYSGYDQAMMLYYRSYSDNNSQDRKFSYDANKSCVIGKNLFTVYNRTYGFGETMSCCFTNRSQYDIIFPRLTKDSQNLRLINVNNVNDYITLKMSKTQLDIPLYTTGDFNGDGYSDIVVVERSGNNGAYKYYILWGTSCSKLSTYDMTNNLTTSTFTSNGSIERIVACDVNGDGLLDIVTISDKGYSIIKNNGTLGSSKFSTLSNNSSDYHTDMYYNPSEGTAFVFGDFNGDGLCDFFKGNPSGNFVYFGSADGTFKKRDFSGIVQCSASTFASCADIDGDGKSELCILKNNGKNTYWYHYSGTLFSLFSSNQNSACDLNQGNIVVGDVNMDGKQEIVSIGYALTESKGNINGIYISKSTSKAYSGLVNKITSPLKTHTIHYTNLLDNSVYTKNGTYKESSNLMALRTPLNIVSSYDEENKNSKANDYTTVYFKYENLIAQVTGKGLLGFEKTSVKNDALNIEQIIENNVGMQLAVLYPTKTCTKTWSGSSISETTNTYSLSSFGLNSKGYHLLLTKSIEIDRLNTNTCTYVYSSYKFGQPTISSMTKGDVCKKIQYKDFVSNSTYNVFLPQTKEETISNNSGSVIYTTKYAYDGKFRPIKQISLYGTEKSVTTEFSYTGKGNLSTKKISAPGCETQTTTYDYMGSGRFMCYEKKPDGTETKYSWSEGFGRVTKTTTCIGDLSYITTYNTFDGFNNCLKQTFPDGRIQTRSIKSFTGFNPGCYEIKTTLTGSPDKTEVYDADGRLIRLGKVYMDGVIRYSYKQYDDAGRLEYDFYPTQGATPIGNKYTVHKVYDRYGRLTKEEYIDGCTTYSYSSNKITKESPAGTTILEYNTAGQLIKSTTNGKSITFTYAPSGQIATSTAESTKQNLITEMTYDVAGNRISISDPDVGVIKTEFDRYGREIYRLTENGREINTTYDSRGRLTSVKDGFDDAVYTYNNNNQVVKVSSKNYNCTYTYDSFNRVTKKSESVSNSLFETKYSYSNNYGGVAQTTHPSGLIVNNNYDVNGYLKNVTCGSKTIWSLNKLDDYGRVVTENLAGGVIKTIKFNNKEQLCQESAYKESIGLMDLKYIYTGVNITQKEDVLNSNIEQYSYDDQNRLADVTTTKSGVSFNGTHSYDELGNMTKTWDDYWKSISYGQNGLPPHQVSSVSFKNPSVATTTQVTFDSYRMATKISQGDYIHELEYRPDHYRSHSKITKSGKLIRNNYYLTNYEKTINSSGTSREIHYLYGGTGLAAIYVRTDGKDTLFTAVTDRQNSLTAVMDVATNKVEKFAYEPWGMRRNPSNWKENVDSDYPARFSRGYCMHEHLPELGLINMGGRIFNQRTNQFLSPDPFRQSPGDWLNANRFSYCMNNPVMFTDPNGEVAWFVPIIIGAAIGGAVNLGVQAYNGKIDNVGQGFAAFGWGALAGGVASGVCVVAGAEIAGTAAAASVSYAFGTGVISTAFNSMILSMGNHYTFGDPMISEGQLFLNSLLGGLSMGLMQGFSNLSMGNNFWTGLSKRTPDFDLIPQKTMTETPNEIGNARAATQELEATANQRVTYTINCSDSYIFRNSEKLSGISVERQPYVIPKQQTTVVGYEQRLLNQTDIYHNFPHEVEKIIIENGRPILQSNNDIMYIALGNLNGTNGVYTIGIRGNTGMMYHRCFYSTDQFLKQFYFK